MPIRRKPLLHYWLDTSREVGAAVTVVNLHYHAEKVEGFLSRSIFQGKVRAVFEPDLKGTAGTLRACKKNFENSTVLLVHADNFCQCDFRKFLSYHQISRPKNCPITMMTFKAQTPSACGIVELNELGVVTAFHEKVENPPGDIANGAVYLLEPEVLEWICNRPEVSDFSTQVLPHFIGRIATWHNDDVHIDIGSIEALRRAQTVIKPEIWPTYIPNDDWSLSTHPIHQQIESGINLHQLKPALSK
jgi:mannose-1-phosphate guanylyltransferase